MGVDWALSCGLGYSSVENSGSGFSRASLGPSRWPRGQAIHKGHFAHHFAAGQLGNGVLGHGLDGYFELSGQNDVRGTSINCHLAAFKRLEPLRSRCHSQKNLYFSRYPKAARTTGLRRSEFPPAAPPAAARWRRASPLDTPRPKGAGILSSLGAHWHCPH